MSGASADADFAGRAQTAPDAVTDAAAELERLRAAIERIDRDIIALIAERVRIARGVGELKRAAGLPTLDPAREAVVVRRAGELARDAGLEDEDVRYIFWHLIGLSRRAQTGAA
jgi:chorismate mutase